MSRTLSFILVCAWIARGASLPAIPPQFHSQAAGATPDPAVDQWWWSFQDPELNSLIARAALANLDLKLAAG